MNKSEKLHFEYGNFAYQLFWHNKGVVEKLVYIAIPFVLALVYCIMLIVCNVFNIREGHPDEVYGVFEDLTNSFVLIYILFFIYFAHGKFQSMMAERLRYFQNVSNSSCLIGLYRARAILTGLSVLIAVIATVLFIGLAEVKSSTGCCYWLNQLNCQWKMYYSAMIFITWYMTANLFLQNSANLLGVYRVFKSGFEQFDYTDKNIRYNAAKLYNCFLLSGFFGVYYLIALFTMYYSDYRAQDTYGFSFALSGSKGIWLIAIALFICAIYFSFIVISRQAFMNSVKDQIRELRKSNRKDSTEYDIERSYDRMMIRNGKIRINWNNVLVFLISSVIPILPTILSLIGIRL